MTKQTTKLETKQKNALKQEKELIKALKEYKKILDEISKDLSSRQHMIGTVQLFKTETPSLIVESRINQKRIKSLITDIETLNFNIAEVIRRI